MSGLDVFTYSDQQVRTVGIDGNAWFVLADVCKVLGLARSAGQVATRLPEGVRQTHTLATAGGPQQMTVVSEAGLYRVVLRSDAPGAEPFIEWVTSDVLPAIRKTGSYGTRAPAELSREDILVMALDSERGRIAAIERAEAAEQQRDLLAAPAARWQEVASADGDFSVGDVAKMLCRAGVNTGQNRLFKHLDEIGWTFRRGEGSRRAMQSAINAGLVTERANRPVTNQHTGELRQVAPQVRITGKGLDRLLREHGCGPVLLPAEDAS